MSGGAGASALCLLFNAGESPAEFNLPPEPGARWRISVDTGKPPPDDIFSFESEPLAPDPEQYRVGPRAFAVPTSSIAAR
jgi:hypothetical protein